MLVMIKNPKQVRLGEVVYLYVPGKPYPDLSKDDATFVVKVPGPLMHVQFCRCDRTGKLLNRPSVKWASVRGRVELPEDVQFVPVIQLDWETVQHSELKKFVVYNKDGALLKRGNDPMYYHPRRQCFTFVGRFFPGNPLEIITLFAKQSGCSVDDIVFVPAK